VKRFVFISSVKVNGESTQTGQAFTEADAPNPQDAYGQSKHEAEQGLRQIAADTGMEVVIIRPPLVCLRVCCRCRCAGVGLASGGNFAGQGRCSAAICGLAMTA